MPSEFGCESEDPNTGPHDDTEVQPPPAVTTGKVSSYLRRKRGALSGQYTELQHEINTMRYGASEIGQLHSVGPDPERGTAGVYSFGKNLEIELPSKSRGSVEISFRCDNDTLELWAPKGVTIRCGSVEVVTTGKNHQHTFSIPPGTDGNRAEYTVRIHPPTKDDDDDTFVERVLDRLAWVRRHM